RRVESAHCVAVADRRETRRTELGGHPCCVRAGVQPAMLSSPCGEVFLEEPPAPGPYAAGDRICGKYRLIEPIGFRGVGSVWRAHNEILDAPVALKLIRSDARWSGSSERLLLEARAAAGLRHGSIVRVFDFGKTRHRDPFIAMELLQGESLRQLLDRER